MSVREPGVHAGDGRAEQPHALDVGHLAAHVLRAHVDDALQAEQRARRRGGHAVLARAGLGDDPRLAHALGQQALAERVVELVRARVHQVLALEPDRPAGGLGEPLARGRAGSAGRRSRRPGGAPRRGSPRRRAPRSRRPRARPARASASRARTGRRRGRTGAPPRSSRRHLHVGRRGHEGAQLVGVLDAGRGLDARGDVDRVRVAPRRCRRRRSPRSARRRGSRARSSGAGRRAPSPTSRPSRRAARGRPCRAGGSRRCGSARGPGRSAAASIRTALMTFAPVRRPTSAQNDGPSSPCSCTWVRWSVLRGARDLVERRVDEHADELRRGAAAQRRSRPRRRGRRRAGSRPRG